VEDCLEAYHDVRGHLRAWNGIRRKIHLRRLLFAQKLGLSQWKVEKSRSKWESFGSSFHLLWVGPRSPTAWSNWFWLSTMAYGSLRLSEQDAHNPQIWSRALPRPAKVSVKTSQKQHLRRLPLTFSKNDSIWSRVDSIEIFASSDHWSILHEPDEEIQPSRENSTTLIETSISCSTNIRVESSWIHWLYVARS